MANGGNIEVAKAYVTIVPSLEGSQGTITKELTGITDEASEKAGESGGSKFGSTFASALKGGAVAIGAALATATAAAVGTGKAFVNATQETAKYGDMVDKTAQKLGLSNDAFQSYDYVLNLAGTDMQSMTTGLKTLTNKLDDAKNGSEEAQAMFAALGLSMDDLATMSREDIFKATITGFQGMEDSAERAALANDLFGKSGQNLTPVFNMTAEETEALIEQAHEYGMVMSDEAVSASADYVDAMTTMQKTMQGLKNNLMTSFLPGMTTVMNGLAGIFAGDQSAIGQIKQGLTSIIGNLVMLAPQFFDLAETLIMSLLEGFAPLLPSLVGALFNFINNGLKTVVGMIPDLIPVVLDGIKGICEAIYKGLPLIIDGLLTMITELVTWLAEDDNVTTFINGIVDLVTLIVGKFGEILPVLLPAIVKIIVQVATCITSPENTTKLVTAVLQVIAALVVAIGKSLPDILDLVINTTTNIVDTLAQWGSTLLSSFKNWFADVLPKIKEFGGDILDQLSDLPGEFKDLGKNLLAGLWEGIEDKLGWLKDQIKSIGSSVTKSAKKALGIKSPSRLWKEEIGRNLALGLGIGFEDEMDVVKGDMIDSMSGLTASMTTEVTAYGSGGASTLGGNTYNGGSISINVYGAEGQNVNDLANAVAYKLEEMTKRRLAVYG